MISVDIVAEDEPLSDEGIVSTYEEWESHIPSDSRHLIDFEGVAFLTDLIDHYAIQPIVILNGQVIEMTTASRNGIDEIRDIFGGEDVIFHRLVRTGPRIDPGTFDVVYEWIVQYQIIKP